jgi:hypothetical protein
MKYTDPLGYNRDKCIMCSSFNSRHRQRSDRIIVSRLCWWQTKRDLACMQREFALASSRTRRDRPRYSAARPLPCNLGLYAAGLCRRIQRDCTCYSSDCPLPCNLAGTQRECAFIFSRTRRDFPRYSSAHPLPCNLACTQRECEFTSSRTRRDCTCYSSDCPLPCNLACTQRDCADASSRSGRTVHVTALTILCLVT